MRDPARIDRVLKLVTQLWHKNPNLRLMQLLTNATGTEPSIYYIEDDVLESLLLEDYLGEKNEKNS